MKNIILFSLVASFTLYHRLMLTTKFTVMLKQQYLVVKTYMGLVLRCYLKLNRSWCC